MRKVFIVLLVVVTILGLSVQARSKLGRKEKQQMYQKLDKIADLAWQADGWRRRALVFTYIFGSIWELEHQKVI
jgi:hypothetical protein